MSQKLLGDLMDEVDVHTPKVAARITAFVLVVADRIAALGGDAVKASDLAATLRLDPDAIGEHLATNPPEREPEAPRADAPKEGMQPQVDPAAGGKPVVDPAKPPVTDPAVAPAAKS